jgi:hypothetical protein
VEVRPLNLVEWELQLSPTVVPEALNRCIRLEFFTNCVEEPYVIEDLFEFGGGFNLPGYATGIEMNIPAGRYTCAAATDPLHTLRSSAPMQITEGRFLVSFTGDPHFGGNWLIGGNLNGDRFIDGADLGILLDELAKTYDSDADGTPDGHTPCGAASPHADINGDGIVDAIDQVFIDDNWLVAASDGCCPGLKDAERSAPIAVITTRGLENAGLKQAVDADLNADGVISVGEIAAYLQGERAPAKNPRLRTRSGR